MTADRKAERKAEPRKDAQRQADKAEEKRRQRHDDLKALKRLDDRRDKKGRRS